MNHTTRFFINYLLNTLPYPSLTTAVPQHLSVERHAAIPVVYVEGADDLLLRFDPYQLARTKPERRLWGLVQFALNEREPTPSHGSTRRSGSSLRIASCAMLKTPINKHANIAQPPTFPDRTSRMYEFAFQGAIRSGVARSNSVAWQA